MFPGRRGARNADFMHATLQTGAHTLRVQLFTVSTTSGVLVYEKRAAVGAISRLLRWRLVMLIAVMSCEETEPHGSIDLRAPPASQL